MIANHDQLRQELIEASLQGIPQPSTAQKLMARNKAEAIIDFAIQLLMNGGSDVGVAEGTCSFFIRYGRNPQKQHYDLCDLGVKFIEKALKTYKETRDEPDALNIFARSVKKAADTVLDDSPRAQLIKDGLEQSGLLTGIIKSAGHGRGQGSNRSATP